MLSNDQDALLWRMRFNELGPPVYRFLLRVTGGDEDTAKDYLSEVFLTLWMLESTQGDRIIVTRALAFSVARKALKRQQRDFAVHDRINERNIIPLTVADGEARKRETPESIHLRMEEAEMVFEALEAQGRDVCGAWTLHRIDGLTIKKTAAAMGKSPTTTKKMINKGDMALEKLRTERGVSVICITSAQQPNAFRSRHHE